MSYQYAEEKPAIFTEQGQRMFLKIRDKIDLLLKTSGAVRMEEIILGVCGSSWPMMACVDRMVELGEIRELTKPKECAGQHRVFVSTRF